MEDKLYCPVCDREMTFKETIGTASKWGVQGCHEYLCDIGHERVLVKFNFDPLFVTTYFVYLGDGCYVVLNDNTSCERAIARMRREYLGTVQRRRILGDVEGTK